MEFQVIKKFMKMNKWKFACPLTWLSTYFYEFLCARRADNRNWHLTREFLHFTSSRLYECCKIINKRNRNNWGWDGWNVRWNRLIQSSKNMLWYIATTGKHPGCRMFGKLYLDKHRYVDIKITCCINWNCLIFFMWNSKEIKGEGRRNGNRYD